MIRFEQVSKVYSGNVQALDNINLHIKRGELLVLIGPSGCGKTTLLETINQLEKQTSGHVYINDQNISKVNEVELRRNIGYVIQQVGLFPHLSIGCNVGLVPRLKKWEKNCINIRTRELLRMVGMNPSEYIDRLPHELSGGQKQRIGFLRALAAEPDIILMDEPFASLDPITRENLQDELRRIQGKLKKTIVFVTHDMDEALKLGDRIIVMKKGGIVQVASPVDLLKKPVDKFVERFVGVDKLANRAETLTVDEVMTTTLITILPDAGVATASQQMCETNVDYLLVADDNGVFLGIVTAGDIERHKFRTTKVEDLLLQDISTVPENSSIKAAYKALLLGNADVLPVVGNTNRLKGIVTKSTLAEVIYRFLWDSND